MLLSVSYEENLNIEVSTLFTLLLDTLKETGKLDKIEQGSVIVSNGVESKVIDLIENQKLILEMNYKGDLYQQHYYFTNIEESKTLLKYEEYYFSTSKFRTLNFKIYRLINKKNKRKRAKQMFNALKLESR